MHGLTIDIWDITISYIYGLTQPEQQIKMSENSVRVRNLSNNCWILCMAYGNDSNQNKYCLDHEFLEMWVLSNCLSSALQVAPEFSLVKAVYILQRNCGLSLASFPGLPHVLSFNLHSV